MEQTVAPSSTILQAVISILVGVVVALVSVWVSSETYKSRMKKRRKAYLNTINNQLERNKTFLSDMKDAIESSPYLHMSELDPTPYHNFLASEIVELENDKELIESLHRFLDNVSKYNYEIAWFERMIPRIEKDGYPEVTADEKHFLTEIIDECIKNIDNGMDEIKRLIK